MKTRAASLGQLQELFRAAEATAGPLPADGASDGAAATASSPARPQHNSLQPPAEPEGSLLHHQSLQLQPLGSLAQQHSMGLLERWALGEQTRLRVGLPARGGSKTFSISSGLGSEADLPGALAAAPSPRPLQPYGEAVAALLARRCRKAQRMLAELQRPVFSVHEGGERLPLPAAALRFCKGLAFVKQRKAGALCSWNWGDAMVVQRLPDGSWSAPCFMQLRYASLGLTLGMQSMRSVYVLQSAAQIAAFTHDSAAATLDATMPAELDPFEMNAPIRSIRHQDLSLPPQADKPHRAMATDGVMWDFSLRVGMTYVNDRMHAQLYGEGVRPEEILSGRVALPPELLPLYLDIEERASEARVIRHTVSKFELVRQQSVRTPRVPPLTSRRSFQKHSSISLGTPSQNTEAGFAGSGLGGRGSPCASPPTGPAAAAAAAGSGSSGGEGAAGACIFGGGGSGSFKLFDVHIEFEEVHTYEQQRAEGEAAARAATASTAQTAGPAAPPTPLLQLAA
ncbi:hypothetical protein ABPG75_010273 [Micractinium tetrahymenae]